MLNVLWNYQNRVRNNIDGIWKLSHNYMYDCNAIAIYELYANGVVYHVHVAYCHCCCTFMFLLLRSASADRIRKSFLHHCRSLDAKSSTESSKQNCVSLWVSTWDAEETKFFSSSTMLLGLYRHFPSGGVYLDRAYFSHDAIFYCAAKIWFGKKANFGSRGIKLNFIKNF